MTYNGHPSYNYWNVSLVAEGALRLTDEAGP